SSVPSPPSASGSRRTSEKRRRSTSAASRPRASASAAPAAVSVPRNLSGQTSATAKGRTLRGGETGQQSDEPGGAVHLVVGGLEEGRRRLVGAYGDPQGVLEAAGGHQAVEGGEAGEVAVV